MEIEIWKTGNVENKMKTGNDEIGGTENEFLRSHLFPWSKNWDDSKYLNGVFLEM